MRLILILLLLPAFVFAQEFEFQQEFDTIPVEIEGWQPFCPWAGGLTGSNPAVVDFDFDGDMDFFVGEYFGKLTYFLNIGIGANPVFHFESNYYDSIDVGARNHPCFRDMDADDDLDLIMGDNSEHVYFYRNIGTVQEPIYQLETINLVPYPPDNWGPELIDIDSDGDYDLFCGYNQITYYRNDGTPEVFSFTLVTDNFEGISVSGRSTPEFCDIDADGDYDLFIGEKDYGIIWYYRNDGDSANYNFTYVTNNFAGIDVGETSSPEFADIDGDGDYDLFVGAEEDGIYYFENRGDPQSPYYALTTENYLTLDLGTRTNPQLIDINDDGKLDLLTPDYTTLHYYENIGTIENPYFQFIQEGWQSIAVNAIKPFFVDIDADGDYDLFCGEGAIPGPPTLALYINQGTPQEPQLVLYDPEYIINGAFHVNINPGLTDIDADGDYDLFISAGQGKFYFYQNNGDPFTPNFTYVDSQWQGIQFYYPYYGWKGFSFGDLDDDGDYDLLMQNPEQDNLRFYRNFGTPQSPVMNLETVEFFDENIEHIYTPFLVDIDSELDLDLFIGDGTGGIFFFRNVTGQNEVGPKRPYVPYPKLDFSIGPNPANPVTWISFTLPAPQEATVAVYNILGAKVTTLTSGLHMPGTHNVIWNASQYSSGVYIIRLETPQNTFSQRVMVVK